MRRILTVACTLALAACDAKVAESPTPTHYTWPERLDYRMEHVSELQRDARPVQRLETHKLLKLTVREDQYVLVYDSVIKTTLVPGEPVAVAPYLPEDTLAFYVGLGRRGELGRVMAGCDPAVPECARVLPSAVAMEMRRIVPGLPVWPVPVGGTWTDTLRFDDSARPGGSRGSLITTYGPVRDTTIGGTGYWLVPWRTLRVAFQRPRAGSGLAPERPVRDDGLTLIDRRRLLPVLSTWAGAVGAPPELRAIGIEASAFRTRAYLVGSPFDSAFAPTRPSLGPGSSP